MKLYELITPSDPITFYAPDIDIAEAVAIFVGNGKAGLKAIDGSEAPNTMVFLGFSTGQEERFAKTINERTDEVIASGKTFAVCEPNYREEYDKLTNSSTDEKEIEQWDNKHRSSMSNWCGFARNMKKRESVK